MTGGSAGHYELSPSVGGGGPNLLNLAGQAGGVLRLPYVPADTRYLLQVTSPNLLPTIYDLSFRLTGDPVVVDEAPRMNAGSDLFRLDPCHPR